MKCGRISSLPFEQTLFAPKISKECASLVRGFGGEQTTKINADTLGLSCRKISLDGLWMFGLRLRDSMICISVHTVGIMETSSQQTLSGLIPVPLLFSKHVSSAYCIDSFGWELCTALQHSSSKVDRPASECSTSCCGLQPWPFPLHGVSVPCLKRVDDAKLLTMPGNQNAQSPIAGLGKSALLDAAAFSDSERSDSLRRMSDCTGQTKGFRRVASHHITSILLSRQRCCRP